jgi:hypothetical protein
MLQQVIVNGCRIRSINISNTTFKNMTPKNKTLCIIFVITVVTALWVYFAIGTDLTYLVLFMGGITFFMIFALWDTPPKHKEFSNSDRLRASSLARGCNPPPELWTPDMPMKRNKHKKK